MPESFDQMTVVEMVYHHPQGDKTEMVESRYSRVLETQNQMYRRNFIATEEWTPLDCGWVPEPGLLHIENREGQNLQRAPTPEEAADIAKRILELTYAPDREFNGLTEGWLILPGESMRCYPTDATSLRIRSRHGKAKYTLCLIPR